MALTLNISTHERGLDLTGYTVKEYATPLTFGESGGMPTFSASARAITDGPIHERTGAMTRSTLLLTDDGFYNSGDFKGRGRFYGRDPVSRTSNGVIDIDAASALAPFNKDVNAVARHSESQATAFRYYCSLVGIPVTKLFIDPIFETRSFIAGAWSGVAWDYIRDFCVAVNGEISLDGSFIVLRPPRLHTVVTENFSNVTLNVDAGELDPYIEVVYNQTKLENNRLLYKSDATIQVEPGGYTQLTVNVENISMLGVYNPGPVWRTSNYDYRYGGGEYVIFDQQNRQVDPVWWSQHGGRINVTLGKVANTLDIDIFAASASDQYEGPFTVGEYVDGDQAQGALYITGIGLFQDKEVLPIYTGAPIPVVPEGEEPENVQRYESVFINSRDTAYRIGVMLAGRLGGPQVTITGYMPYDSAITDGQEFGVIPGSRVLMYDNIFRITEATYSPSGIDFSAVSDMLFSDLYEVYAVTFQDMNTRYSGFTFADVNVSFPPETRFDEVYELLPVPKFSDVDAVYEYASFADQAVFPFAQIPVYDGIDPTFEDVNKFYADYTFDAFNNAFRGDMTFRQLDVAIRNSIPYVKKIVSSFRDVGERYKDLPFEAIGQNGITFREFDTLMNTSQ